MLTSIGREFRPAKGMIIKMKLKEKVEKRLNIIGTHVNLIDANKYNRDIRKARIRFYLGGS